MKYLKNYNFNTVTNRHFSSRGGDIYCIQKTSFHLLNNEREIGNISCILRIKCN